MKLTEIELNYILSECVRYMLIENELDEDILDEATPKVTKNSGWDKFKTNADNAMQTVGNAVTNSWKNSSTGLGKVTGVIKTGLNAIPGGAALGLAKGAQILAGMGEPPTTFLGNLMQFSPHALAAFGILKLGAAVTRMFQTYKKNVPNNKLQAFKCALRALPEYESAAEICKMIQLNFNRVCEIYNDFADDSDWNKKNVSWNTLRNEVDGSTFELSQGILKGAKGEVSTDTDFNNLEIGINEANEVNVQQELTDTQIQKIFERCTNGDEAYNFVKEIAQAYAESYQLYYTWRAYLKAVMLKHRDITWENIKTGKLPGVTNFLRGSTNNVDVNELSQNNYVTLSIVNNNYKITNKKGYSTDYIVLKGNNRRLYCIEKNELQNSSLLRYINSGVKEFSIPKKMALANKQSLLFNNGQNDRSMFLLTTDDIIAMQPIKQQTPGDQNGQGNQGNQGNQTP